MILSRAFAGLAAAAFALGLASAPAAAMTFEATGEGDVILAHGPIIPGDTDRLKKLLNEDFRLQFGGVRPITLHLHSPGGSVVAGIELTNYVRERGLMTHIKQGNGCYSACTFVFMGGVRRTALGEFGIHAMAKSKQGQIVTFSDRDLEAVQQLTSTLINLALTMIGDARVIAAMLNTPNETIQVVSDKNMAEWRIITAALRPAQRMQASFDCSAQGLSEVKLMVCDNLVLADSDRRLAAAYEWLGKHNVVPELAAEQERWTKYLDSCRHVSGPERASARMTCVREAYDVRLRQLEGLMSFHQANTRGPAASGWKELQPTQDITTIKPPGQPQ